MNLGAVRLKRETYTSPMQHREGALRNFFHRASREAPCQCTVIVGLTDPTADYCRVSIPFGKFQLLRDAPPPR
jgi:hypothetical protein